MPNPKGSKGNSMFHSYPRASGPRKSLVSSNWYTFREVPGVKLVVDVLEVAAPVHSRDSRPIIYKWGDKNKQIEKQHTKN